MPTRRLAVGALCAATVITLAPLLTAVPAFAAPGQSVQVGVSANQLIQEIAGTGVTGVSNVSYTGAGAAAGIFSGMGGIGIDSGIVLSSGSAAAVVGPNSATGYSLNNGMPGDATLNAIAGASTYDAATLQFDFVPSSSLVTFTYLYGSDEYPEWVNAGYNDAFAIVVNGVNCAVVPGTSTPITIDTINVGTNSGYYVNGTGSAVTQMDGFTTPLTCLATVVPNAVNHFRFSIADGGDPTIDSWALIKSGTLVANSAPTTQSVSASTYSGTPVATALLGADVDGDTLSYSYTQPANGTLSGTAPDLVYTPSNSFVGVDTFTYTVTALGMTSAPATVSIAVATNTTPTATAQSASTERELALALTLAGVDAEGAALGYAVVTGPTHGTLSGAGSALSYTPAAGYTGADSFTFTVTDGVSTSAPATVSISVVPNDAPTAAAQAVSVEHDLTLPVVLTGSDAEGASLSFAIATPPAHGTISGSAPNLDYTPAAGFEGTDSFTFTANDGRFTSAPATVTITVIANEAPTATSQALAVEHDLSLAVSPMGADPEGAVLTFSVDTPPAHGIVTVSGSSWVYIPADGFVGTDTFTYLASDGRFDSAPATVTITVTANEVPTAEGQTLSTRREESLAIDLVASDADGSSLSYTVNAPAHGTLSGTAPHLEYTPDADYVGADSFSYTVNDGRFTSAAATVEVTVVADDAPLAQLLARSTFSGRSVAVTLEGTDAEGATLSYAVASAPTHGTLSGTAPYLVYTPDSGFVGTDSFTYTTDDGRFTSSAATVTITVVAAPGLPHTGADTTPGVVALALIAAGAAGILFARRRRLEL